MECDCVFIFIEEEGKHFQISVGLVQCGISIFKAQPKDVMDGYLKEYYLQIIKPRDFFLFFVKFRFDSMIQV
jgi:hypothetical protein